MASGFFDGLRARLSAKLEQQLGVMRRVQGLPVIVVNTRPDIDSERVLERLDGALGLVARLQPWRIRHLRRDVARIEVRRYPCRAAYHPGTRSCLIELTFTVNPEFSLAQIAASIVHEGMHARVHAMGAQVGPDDHAREERICRRAELEFGLAVPPPDGQAVVERALASLRLSDQDVAPAVDWEEASRRVEQADRDALG